jgi:hypothetical protein
MTRKKQEKILKKCKTLLVHKLLLKFSQKESRAHQELLVEPRRLEGLELPPSPFWQLGTAAAAAALLLLLNYRLLPYNRSTYNLKIIPVTPQLLNHQYSGRPKFCSRLLKPMFLKMQKLRPQIR